MLRMLRLSVSLEDPGAYTSDVTFDATGTGDFTPQVTFDGTCDIYINGIFDSSLTSTVEATISITEGDLIECAFSDFGSMSGFDVSGDPVAEHIFDDSGDALVDASGDVLTFPA